MQIAAKDGVWLRISTDQFYLQVMESGFELISILQLLLFEAAFHYHMVSASSNFRMNPSP